MALATCSELPDLDDDERLVMPALAQLGVEAQPAVWADRFAAWSTYDLVVIRSTWDYMDRRDDFIAWTRELRRVRNAAPVLAWNTDKTYLRDLAAAGIPVVPTTWLQPGDGTTALAEPAGPVVVKPAVSGGSRNTERYEQARSDAAAQHVARLLGEGRTVMVQPYMPSVDARGETGLIYIDGEFSHAINKGPMLLRPGAAEGRLFAREEIRPAHPNVDERALAEAVLDALTWPRRELLYARVDVVMSKTETPLLLELELTEPSLFLGLSPGAPERFATAIARHLAVAALD